jgi:membrane associated rhomboid family serine protease
MVLPLRDENPTRRRAYVTLALIAANVIIFVSYEPSSFRALHDPSVSTEAGSQSNQLPPGFTFLVGHAAVPCEVTHGKALSPQLADECLNHVGLRQAESSTPFFKRKNVYLAVLVSMFLHASWAHLLGNMLFLWIFGNNVEDRLGPIPYLAFYAVCGTAAAAAHIYSDPNSLVPVLGASGAIAGVMGAYLVFFPRARILSIVPLFFFFFVRLPAWLVLVGWFVLQFFTGPNSGVAWIAHVGGFVAGVIIAFMVRPRVMRDELPVRPVGYGPY